MASDKDKQRKSMRACDRLFLEERLVIFYNASRYCLNHMFKLALALVNALHLISDLRSFQPSALVASPSTPPLHLPLCMVRHYRRVVYSLLVDDSNDFTEMIDCRSSN